MGERRRDQRTHDDRTSDPHFGEAAHQEPHYGEGGDELPDTEEQKHGTERAEKRAKEKPAPAKGGWSPGP